MKQIMKCAAVFALLLTIISAVWNHLSPTVFISAISITFGTIAYHLLMRIFIGTVIDRIMHNHADYNKTRYHVSSREIRFYEKLGLQHWKGKIPSYDPDLFDRKKHTWDEIARSMCQAEVIHETIAVLSFLPILAGLWFGEWPVFIITSLAAASIDLMLAIVQRYNRPKIIRLVQMIHRRKSEPH